MTLKNVSTTLCVKAPSAKEHCHLRQLRAVKDNTLSTLEAASEDMSPPLLLLLLSVSSISEAVNVEAASPHSKRSRIGRTANGWDLEKGIGLQQRKKSNKESMNMKFFGEQIQY